MDIFGMILTIALILAACALVWLIIELALAAKKVRRIVCDIQPQLKSTISNLEQITYDVQPVIKSVDTTVDRISLTVNSVNQEMLRVDQILENVTDVTGSLNKTMDAVDNVANAPLNFVSAIADKVKGKVAPKGASAESVNLGREKSANDWTVSDGSVNFTNY